MGSVRVGSGVGSSVGVGVGRDGRVRVGVGVGSAVGASVGRVMGGSVVGNPGGTVIVPSHPETSIADPASTRAMARLRMPRRRRAG